MNTKQRFLLVTLASVFALLMGADAHDIHHQDYAFILPKGYYLTLAITFHSSQENNLVLWQEAGPTAIAQWNNYFDNAGHRVATPYRSVSLDNWKNGTASAIRLFFTSSHKNGGPGTGDWNNSNNAQVIDSKPETANQPGYTFLKWNDGSSPDAVSVTANFWRKPITPPKASKMSKP